MVINILSFEHFFFHLAAFFDIIFCVPFLNSITVNATSLFHIYLYIRLKYLNTYHWLCINWILLLIHTHIFIIGIKSHTSHSSTRLIRIWNVCKIFPILLKYSRFGKCFIHGHRVIHWNHCIQCICYAYSICTMCVWLGWTMQFITMQFKWKRMNKQLEDRLIVYYKTTNAQIPFDIFW